jgi:short-subunit dehydrogenase
MVHNVRRMTRSRALVTGASSGIGLAFARRLAADNYDLVVVARSGDRLNELAEELKREHAAEVEVLVADLSTADGVSRVETRLADATAPVDLLVNNAGFGTFGRFAELPVEKEIEEIELNVVALMRLSRAILPSLVQRRAGGVINIASIAAFQPGPFEATYCATKAFVNSFSQALHEEVRGDGVKVLCVCPGLTITEFQEKGGASTAGLPKFASQTAEEVVDDSMKAFGRGRALIVTGAPNKALAFSTRFTPAPMLRRLSAVVGKRLSGV